MNIKIPDEFIEELILEKIKLFTKEKYFNTFSNILSKLSLDLYTFKKKRITFSFFIKSIKRKKFFIELEYYIFINFSHKKRYNPNRIKFTSILFSLFNEFMSYKNKKIIKIK